MKCESCGAEYRMKDEKCPFCEAENPVLAQIRREQILGNYDREARRMRDSVPEGAVKKWTGVMLVICEILAGAALLAGLVTLIWGPVRARIDYRISERWERELEELLAQGDMEGICTYMRETDISSSEMRKFHEIESVYSAYRRFMEKAEYLDSLCGNEDGGAGAEQQSREQIEDSATSMVSQGGLTLALCRQYCEDRVIWGTETLFEEYAAQVRGKMEEMGVSGQLLDWMSRSQEGWREDDRFRQAVDAVTETYTMRQRQGGEL